MIIDEISLHNFGVFRGEQSVTLTPPSQDRPIVLFGGLNGCGKTTILEGLQLALYGKRSPTRHKNGTYEDYLATSINRGVSGGDGAAVEVVFRSVEEGASRQYSVRRSWARREKRTPETLEVSVDGVFDQTLTDTWAEHVERFIPERLSHLFFFDGEQIESLADPDKSTELLLFAINALLGVDLVDKLNADLTALDRRKRKETKHGPERDRIQMAEKELEAAKANVVKLKQRRASRQNDHDRETKRLAGVEKELSLQGGDLLAQRQQIEHEIERLASEIKSARHDLVEATAGSLPLALVEGLRRSAEAQVDRETTASHSELVQATIGKRDKRLLTTLRKSGATADVLTAAKSFMARDAKKSRDQVAPYLSLDAETSQRLHGLPAMIQGEAERCERLLEKLSKSTATQEALERKLASVPEEQSLADLHKRRDTTQSAIADCRCKMAELDGQVRSAEFERERAARALDKLLRSEEEAELDNKDVVRFVKHGQRVRDTLERFRIAMTTKHAERLAELILDCYQQLLRKESMVEELTLDPETCEISLRNRREQVLNPEALSAGERQLLAISLLWGLGRASGRPLPVVVDTPLGRLDSGHRSHLVDRYFPFASHQVILLSTDEEIDADFFKKLEPKIGHAYRLEFDDAADSSRIKRGYFWEN